MLQQARDFKVVATDEGYIHATVKVKWLFKETTLAIYSNTGNIWYWLDNGYHTGRVAQTQPSLEGLWFAAQAKEHLESISHE